MVTLAELTPGDKVKLGGRSAVFIGLGLTPGSARLRTVVWRLDSGEWSVDQLYATQEVGELDTESANERHRRLISALGPRTHKLSGKPTPERLVETEIREWLNRKIDIVKATVGSPPLNAREAHLLDGIERLRQSIDDYWYTVALDIVKKLRSSGYLPASEEG